MRLIAAAVVATAFVTSPGSATIVWQKPVTVSGPADVLTLGTLHAAISANVGPVTVNSVPFSGYSLGAPVLIGDAIRISGALSTELADPAYNQLLSVAAFRQGFGPFGAFTVNSLTVGRSYAMQIWQPVWDTNWATTYFSGTSFSQPVFASGFSGGPDAPAVSRPQYVIGSFVADSSTLGIAFQTTTNYATYAAVQVRDITGLSLPTVPEPASWMMLITGFGFTGAAMRRRRTARA